MGLTVAAGLLMIASSPSTDRTSQVLANAALAAKMAQSVAQGDGAELSKHGFDLMHMSAWLDDENGAVTHQFIDAKLEGCAVSKIESEMEFDEPGFSIKWNCEKRATFLPADGPGERLPRDCFNAGYSLTALYWTDTPQLILRDRADWSQERCGRLPIQRPPAPR